MSLRFERIQIHRIGVEDILIDHLRPIPTLCHVYLVGVCLLCLFVTLTDDIGLLSGIDSIGVAIVAIVEPVALGFLTIRHTVLNWRGPAPVAKRSDKIPDHSC